MGVHHAQHSSICHQCSPIYETYFNTYEGFTFRYLRCVKRKSDYAVLLQNLLYVIASFCSSQVRSKLFFHVNMQTQKKEDYISSIFRSHGSLIWPHLVPRYGECSYQTPGEVLEHGTSAHVCKKKYYQS